MATVRAYPKGLAHDVRLRGGALIHIRAIRADDTPGLLALFDRLRASLRGFAAHGTAILRQAGKTWAPPEPSGERGNV